MFSSEGAFPVRLEKSVDQRAKKKMFLKRLWFALWWPFGGVDGLSYWASCAKGLEHVLATELEGLGAREIAVSSRGVAFGGDEGTGYRAMIESRVANRIFQELRSGDVRNREDVYDLGRSVDWRRMMDTGMTLSVETKLGEDVPTSLSHSHFTSLTLKNAIVDAFRESFGLRPSVEKHDPDVPLMVYVHRGEATLFRSLTGHSLHKRGYRRGGIHVAALRETIAAGCLAFLMEDIESHNDLLVVDPMCGSGTFAIEAALLAHDVAPGLLRAGRFGDARSSPPSAVRWRDADHGAYQIALDAAADRVRHEPRFRVAASDVNPAALTLAKHDIQAAGVDKTITVAQKDIRDLDITRDFGGTHAQIAVVSNPPWGQRLKGAETAWQGMGSFLKRYPGSTAALLCGNTAFSRDLKLKPSKRRSIAYAGSDMKLLHYSIFDDDHHLRDDDDDKRGSSPLATNKRRRHDLVAFPDEDQVHDDGLDRLTVVKLKAQLRKKGLKVIGRKQDLINRLREHDARNLLRR